ncbi:hypothetical protein CMV_015032, partial [Castanea mollissima]
MSKLPSAFDALMSNARVAASKKKPQSSSPNKHKTLDSNPPQNRQNSSPPGNAVSDTNPEESNGTKQVKENGSCVQDPNLSGSEKKMKTKVINVEDRVALLKSKMSELKKKAGDFDLRPVASWGEGECVPFMFLCLVFDIISNELRQILITDIVCNMLRTVMVTTQAGFAGFDVFGLQLWHTLQILYIFLQNLPYGVFKPEPASPARPGVAIGDYVLDLSVVASAGLFDGPVLKNNSDSFLQPDLNKFLALGRPAWKEARATLQKLLSATEPALRDNAALRQKALVPLSKVKMLVPISIGDYTDFFSSMHHAKNCGTIFRGPENPIPANWFHLPIAYHGRASSIVISGTDIIRPRGQGHPAGNSPPYFGPSLKLDFELEM